MKNKQQQDKEDFPGYPHYPAKEDIMDSRSQAKRVDADMEQMPAFHNSTNPHHLTAGIPPASDTAADNVAPAAPSTETNASDITAEERKILDDADLPPTIDEDNLKRASLDTTDFDGDPLNEESFGSSQSGDGLDITNDTTLPTDDDEENQYWSMDDGENDNMVEGTP